MENMKQQQTMRQDNESISMGNQKQQQMRQCKESVNKRQQQMGEAGGSDCMENSKEQPLREVIADKYFTTIRKIRASLDEIELTFLKYPDVDIALYKCYEKDVIDMNILYIDQFVKAFGENDCEGMEKIHDGIIEAVIEISQKFQSD